MGLLDKLEEVAGAVAAVEGIKKLDPNASFLTEAAAALTGYKGVEAVKERLEEQGAPAAGAGDATPGDGSP